VTSVAPIQHGLQLALVATVDASSEQLAIVQRAWQMLGLRPAA